MEEQPRPKGKAVGRTDSLVAGSSPAEGTTPDPLKGLYLGSEELANGIIALQNAIIEWEGEEVSDIRLDNVETMLTDVCYAFHELLDARADVVRRFKEPTDAAP